MKKLLSFLVFFVVLSVQNSDAQYYQYAFKTIPGYYGMEMYDTMTVSGLVPATMDASWGLDSVTLNINYDFSPDLQISIISPDGTIVHLSDNEGYGPNYTMACFSMDVNNFVAYSSAPFTGNQQPENWLGMINNGHSGNGKWMIHIVNQTTSGPDTGTLLNWGLHFTHTPATPNFFDSSKLPIVVIDTKDTVVTTDGTTVEGRMGIISNPGMNHLSDPHNNYNANIKIHVRGSSSRSFPTKSYDVSTEDITRNDSDASLLGMPADHSWVLYAPWDDKALIRNVITYRLSNDMGEYAVRTRLCQVVMNGDYRGFHVLMEKISRGSNRVDVHKMASTDVSGTALTGGYIFATDRASWGTGWPSNFLACDTGGTQPWYAYVYPKATDIVSAQQNYIDTLVDSFEHKMKYGNIYDTVNGYRKYIDVPSIIDQQLLQEIGHNVDGYRLSTYFHKDRGQKIKGGPIWDFNLAYGNAYYDDGFRYDTYEWDAPCPTPGYTPFWWKVINTDTNYFKELQCRYSNFRLNAFDTTHIQGLIDSLAGVLTIPAQYHYQRWPILGIWEWPNYYVGSTYADEINFLKGWIRNRITFMDTALFNPTCIDTTHSKLPLQVVGNSPENIIKIFPNPTNNYLDISGTMPISKVLIYNLLGQQIYENNEPNTHYNVSLKQHNLSSGIYTVMVFTETGIVRKKITLVE